MLLKIFLTYIYSQNYFYSSIEKINLYKQILYPQISFNIKEEYLKNEKNSEGEIEGAYFHTSNNNFIIEKLEKYYISNKKVVNLMSSNFIKINDYKCFFLIENHKEKIPVQIITVNNLKNHWINKTIKSTNIDNKFTMIKLELINNRDYKINLTKEELAQLNKLTKKNNNICYLMYVLDNLKNISEEIIYIFDPFIGSKILLKELEDIITKQIIIYIYNNIYKTY